MDKSIFLKFATVRVDENCNYNMLYAKYYHRVQLHSVNNFTTLTIPIVILIIPIFSCNITTRPGTSILIALSESWCFG